MASKGKIVQRTNSVQIGVGLDKICSAEMSLVLLETLRQEEIELSY